MQNGRCIVESCGRKLIDGKCPAKHDQHTQEAEHCRCYKTDCYHPAIARVQVDKLMLNMCKNHYDHHFAQEAKEFCEVMELKTVQDKREAIKKLLPTVGNGKGIEHYKQIVADHLNGDSFPAITLQYAYAAINREVAKDDEITVEF